MLAQVVGEQAGRPPILLSHLTAVFNQMLLVPSEQFIARRSRRPLPLRHVQQMTSRHGVVDRQERRLLGSRPWRFRYRRCCHCR